MTNAYNLANARITGLWQRTCKLLTVQNVAAVEDYLMKDYNKKLQMS